MRIRRKKVPKRSGKVNVSFDIRFSFPSVDAAVFSVLLQKRTSVDGALGFVYLQGDDVTVFYLLTSINLSKIKMQYSKILY